MDNPEGICMKRMNPVVALLIITALASGFLLLQDSMLLQPPESGPMWQQPLTLLPKTLPPTVDSVASAIPVAQEVAFSVKGLNPRASSVYVAVFEAEAGFPYPELSSQTTVVSATEEQVRFWLTLPQNQPVAIAIFQDIDGNGKLSKNAIGIPAEPYGFSNNARGLLGPPAFSQAVLIIRADRDLVKPIEIKVR
ncbi:MAG: DUF2141 domain-containing protein [Planctomycetota bacterium]|nr:MAG: DUF2141 domain-containing protein [Planctomycetota bacterium]